MLTILQSARQPITGSELSSRLGVSRQAIVNDIAILRAAGEPILGSPQGYRLEDGPAGLTAVIACEHGPDRTSEELHILVDRGIAVLEVVVDHSVLGEVRANVGVESRADVDRYAEAFRLTGHAPLSAITGGAHWHTVRAPSKDALEAAKRELRERGILRD